MSSKVTAKLRLGAAFSVLLISLTLLAGCKQETEYAPPGYGASVGSLTDTVWKNGSDTIRFGAEGKVTTVPDSWKKDEVTGVYLVEYGDFTYSNGKIFAKVKKVDVSSKEFAKYFEDSVGTILERATFTVPTKSSPEEQGTPVTNYYEMDVTIEGEFTPSTFTMENKPTSGDKFVGTYYDELGRKKIQINKEDGTFVSFYEGTQFIRYWKYQNDGTIYVKYTPFDGSPNEFSEGLTYYLYPHALMYLEHNSYEEKYTPNTVAWK